MARPSHALILALQETADRLETGVTYQWAHMGHCNCGHLAQTITQKSHAELHALALQKHGDWSDKAEQFANEFLADDATPTACLSSRYPIDHVIYQMLDLGLYTQDIVALERLNDKDILATLAPNQRNLNYKNRDHVVLYLRAWAQYLQRQLNERNVAYQNQAAKMPELVLA